MRAAASSFDHVGTFTVLNGAQGVTGAMAEVIQQAGVLAGLARTALMPGGPADGAHPPAKAAGDGAPSAGIGAPAEGPRVPGRPRQPQRRDGPPGGA